MQFLFALVVAASLPVFGAESTNAPVKAELDSAPEARPPASAVQITQRLRRISDGWVLSEQDREKLSITVTNQWQGKVCASPTVRKLSAHGLFLQHESGAFWCGWAQFRKERLSFRKACQF